MSELLREDQQPCPWCGCTQVKLIVSEICCPIQYSANATCADCYAEEPCGSGVFGSREDALGEALGMWNTRQSAPEKGWQPIESAPTGKNGYSFMRLAWGSDGDKCTGDGFRCGDKFFASALFYSANSIVQFELREIEVIPTHWMPLPLPPSVEVPDGSGS